MSSSGTVMPDSASEPLFNTSQVAEIRGLLLRAHDLVVDACLPADSVHVPESVMPVLDAIADAMREVSERAR